MTTLGVERVLDVNHWNDNLFSFTTTRGQSFRFQSGHFVTLGLEVAGRPLMRAYSVVSAAYEEHLEFLSIKVPDGPLTSRLQHLKAGDDVLVSRKPTGSLLVSDLLPGKRLYLLCTGTGLAPFMSIVRDPETYERFDKVILVHGVRRVSELAYHDYLADELPRHEYLAEYVCDKLLYYPTVTREPYRNQGRLTHLIETGKLFEDLALDPLDPATDRVMICGSPEMLNDARNLLDARGFHVSPGIGRPGDYVYERAFSEK
jgi:ferredoxin/flavodoxin---NADP+ reductase